MSLFVLMACLAVGAGVAGYALGRRSRAAHALPLLPDARGPTTPETENECATFLLRLSQELQTPLNSVIGFSDLLVESDLPAAQRHQARLITENGRAMLRLVNDTLELSRIRTGQVRIVNEEFELAEEIQRLVDLFRPMAAAKGLELRHRLSPGVPARLCQDRVHLRQVLLNLLGNAVKFTEQGTVTLTTRAEGGMLIVDVHDTGAGIDPGEVEKLFIPLANAMQPASAFSPVSGLGLAIAAELARAMGGSLGVTSHAENGSCFSLRLPLSTPKPTEQSPASAAVAALASRRLPVAAFALADAPISQAAANLPRRVLLAEDNDINQQLVLAMAPLLNIQLDIAENGQEAVVMANAARDAGCPYHLVLMDVQMPVMDGLAAAKALRRAGHSEAALPIVALTARNQPEDLAASREAGMQEHLLKPVVLADLARTLASLLDGHDVPAGSDDLDVSRLGDGPIPAIHALDHRYRTRKRHLLDLIARTIASGRTEENLDEIVTGLHKLAGVAANFGDEEMGRTARRIEQAMKRSDTASERLRILVAHWPSIRELVEQRP